MDAIGIVFILIAGGFAVLIWKLIKVVISYFLPYDYKNFKQIYPNPLKTLRPSSAMIGPMRCRNTVKVDIYPDKLIVSSMGKAVCLDYFAYSFTKTDVLWSHALIIGPVQTNAPSWLAPDQKINIQLFLSKKNVDFILTLVQQAQQSS